MHTISELRVLTRKPKINAISLDLLREYYKVFLYPFIYYYEITYADGSKKRLS